MNTHNIVPMITALLLIYGNALQSGCFSAEISAGKATCYKDELTTLSNSTDETIKKDAEEKLKAITAHEQAISTTQTNLKDATAQGEQQRQDLRLLNGKIQENTLKREQLDSQLVNDKNALEDACRKAGVWLTAHQYQLDWQKSSGLGKLILFVRYHTCGC